MQRNDWAEIGSGRGKVAIENIRLADRHGTSRWSATYNYVCIELWTFALYTFPAALGDYLSVHTDCL